MQDAQAAFGRKDREVTWDNRGTCCELILTSLVKAERANCVRDGLNDLNDRLQPSTNRAEERLGEVDLLDDR